ncbi:amidase signature domain-containing protein [Penicillium malachiteum]|nr:amidase signature domain-containing protein [Penicillium malachiteum]
MPRSPLFNPLTATAAELAILLDDGKLTSLDIIRVYLRQIQLHNNEGTRLNCIISVVPEGQLLEAARQLDSEREQGKIRSRYHGIPFIAKDSMWTAPSFNLPTTCGAFALKDAVAPENAEIIQKLLDAGMLLIAKANLSEMAGMRGFGGFAGFSTVGGQTQSPYVIGGVDSTDTWLGMSTPGGSSSGSAVSVAAGMAPIALGTETDGSILVPSDRASLYSLKLTVGKASTHGTLPFTQITDSLGPMTKSAHDVASILDILSPIKEGTNEDALTTSFKGMRVGFLDPLEWASGAGAVRPNEDYTQQALEEISAAADKIASTGAIVKRNIKLRRFSSEDDKMFNDVSSTDYVNQLAEFLKDMQGSPVKTMQDLVEFNNDHSSDCFSPGSPGQEILEGALKTSISPTTYDEYVGALRTNNKDLGIDATLQENEIDIIIGTPTGRAATVAALAGYPVGSVPLGYARFNGRPFGLAIFAPANAEALIISAMSAWEATFPKRIPPTQLVNWDLTNSEK